MGEFRFLYLGGLTTELFFFLSISLMLASNLRDRVTAQLSVLRVSVSMAVVLAVGWRPPVLVPPFRTDFGVSF